MVARRLRNHCATCGKPHKKPSTWAYCSKDCENGRRGRDASDSGEADTWLLPIHQERLRLHRQLEHARADQRSGLLAQIARCEQREVAVRDVITAKTDDKRSLAYWSPIVLRECDSWEVSLRRSLAAGVKLGKKLIEAKAALPYGEFGRLFSDHDDAVANALPISRHHGSKLMSIAANGVTGLVAHAQHLPADVETVYVLSRLPADDLQAAIQAGSVSTKTTRTQARVLVTGEPEASEPGSPIDPIEGVVDACRVRLAAFAADHPEHFAEAATRIKGILRGLGRVAAAGGAA